MAIRKTFALLLLIPLAALLLACTSYASTLHASVKVNGNYIAPNQVASNTLQPDQLVAPSNSTMSTALTTVQTTTIYQKPMQPQSAIPSIINGIISAFVNFLSRL